MVTRRDDERITVEITQQSYSLTFSGECNRRMQDFRIWFGDDPETE